MHMGIFGHHATFRPTFPTPLPTTLTTTPPDSSSRTPHPLSPKALESRANWTMFAEPKTSRPSSILPTSSEPMAIKVNRSGAPVVETQPPRSITSSNWYAHCLPTSSGVTPPDTGDGTSASYRTSVELSATRLSPKPMPILRLAVDAVLLSFGRRPALELSEKMRVSGQKGLSTPRAASIILALFDPATPVEYATPRMFLILPTFRK